MAAPQTQDGHASAQQVVAFLGPPASYSHQATKALFPGDEWKLETVVQIKDVFDVVQAGEAAFGVVPFENSTHGPVTFTLDCLADRQGAYADLCVCGEVYLDVHHFLLGRRAPAATAETPAGPAPTPSQQDAGGGDAARGRPLADLSHVERVYSHPQAFGQTAAFLGAHLRGVDTIDVSSTSRAAEEAARDGSGRSAAIASEMAAAASGLEVLARCIEDREDNTTRFLVIRRRKASSGGEEEEGEASAAGGGGGGGVAEGQQQQKKKEDRGRGKRYKTLVSFTVPHRSPGALADVLDAFRRFELDLTSINSLPSLIRPFQYLFFVEFEGSRLHDPDGRVKSALEHVGKVSQGWRWLGSWENQRHGEK